MKKGQVINQVLIYIFGAALFIMLLMFAYRGISNILDSQDLVMITDFKTDLESKVDQLKIRKGSLQIVPFRVPGEFQKLCIADSSGTYPAGLEQEYPQFFNAWKTNTENVFLVPKQEVPIFIEYIQIDQGYFCIDIEGQFELKLEGLGRTVSVMPK